MALKLNLFRLHCFTQDDVFLLYSLLIRYPFLL